jgi:hypothetical protein
MLLPLPPLPPVGGVINQVTGQLPANAITDALGSLTTGLIGTDPGTNDPSPNAPPAGAAPSGPAAAGSGPAAPPATGDGASASASDSTAPTATLKVVSHFVTLAKSGKVRLRVTLSEPGVVALGGSLRPGPGVKRHGHARRVSRAVVRLPSSVLGYRSPGALDVDVALPAAARRALRHAAGVRFSLQATAVDLAHNQSEATLKRQLDRARKVAHLRRNQPEAPHSVVDGEQ